MTIYELYINGILCDLSSDEVVTLLYQSPIFSSLDNIQSNRSYNIGLPPTPTNMRAIGQAARPDVDSDAPYVRLPAALYQDGVPLFTQGFAVVTDIADTINVTLTWGNVDNFQPLFDNSLRDLGPQLKEAGENIIVWNENTAILEASATGEYPGVAFWGVDFGMGISNPKYLHPSVLVSSILSAIERQNGVTIDGKERLAYSKNLGPIIPLTRKKVGPEANGYSNYCDISMAASDILPKEPWVNTRGIFSTSEPRIKLNDSGTSYITLYRPNSPTGEFSLPHNDAGDIPSLKISIYCDDVFLGEGESYEKTKTSDTMWLFQFHRISVQTDMQGVVTVKMSKPISGSMVPVPNPIISIHNSDWDIYFPGFFPVAPNLPDMSQGDFILALMSMNGLFAYADKDSSNTIKLISIDDIIANVQNNDIIDWSDRVILNDFHRVDMPDASIFTIDDLAQSNILDYDNDDDVKIDTYGTITIRNENIEKETELVSLPFSASENATTNEVNCALVPIYEDDGKGGANYSECSPRILSGRGAFMSGIARCIGVFDPWMKFGGEEGIVKTKYASYQKVVDRLRIITIQAKLTALDLYNLDYSKPVYIAQFGQIFAIYSVETGEDGICDCQLLKLKVERKINYYLDINGTTECDSKAQDLVFSYVTNGTIISDWKGGDGISGIVMKNGIIIISLEENTKNVPWIRNIRFGITEDASVEQRLIITQTAASRYKPSVAFKPELPWPNTATLISITNDGNVNLEIHFIPGWVAIASNLPYTLDAGKAAFLSCEANDASQQRIGNISMRYLDEDASRYVDYNVEVSQKGNNVRMVVIDASTDPSLKGQSVLTDFALLSAEIHNTEMINTQVDSDGIISLTFEQVAGYLHIPSLDDYEGDVLEVSLPDVGISGSASVTVPGDIHIVLK